MTPRLATQEWLRTYQPRPGATCRLVCFPHATGNATFYRGWGERLPAEVELAAVAYPGRMDRIAEECVSTMEQMADEVAQALEPLLGADLALFGHSMGAAVAYEVAARLEHRCGQPVRRLFVSGRPSPRFHRSGAKHLGSDDLLWQELRRLGGTSEEALAHPQLRAVLMPTLRSDYQLIETYRPTIGPPLACPITALTGDCDPEAAVDEVGDWRCYTSQDFRLVVLPGGHFYLVPQADAVLAEVGRALGR